MDCSGYVQHVYKQSAGINLPHNAKQISERGETLMLMDVGFSPQVGAVAAGRTLLQALAALHRGRVLTLNNVPVDSSLNRALAALHFLVGVRQFEMCRALI